MGETPLPGVAQLHRRSFSDEAGQDAASAAPRSPQGVHRNSPLYARRHAAPSTIRTAQLTFTVGRRCERRLPHLGLGLLDARQEVVKSVTCHGIPHHKLMLIEGDGVGIDCCAPLIDPTGTVPLGVP